MQEREQLKAEWDESGFANWVLVVIGALLFGAGFLAGAIIF